MTSLSIRLLAGACLLLTVSVGLAHGADSINLLLEDGKHLQGRVVDLHGSMLEIGRRGGANSVPKSEVERWTYVPPEGDADPKPVLVLRNRHEVPGEVTFDETAREWLVRLDVGDARYAADKVLRIIQPNGTCSDGGFTPRRGFEDRVRAAIEKIRGDDSMRQQGGREYLTKAGFFALRYLEEALEEKRDGGADPGGRLIDIAMRERIRVAMPEPVAERFPNLDDVLFSGKTDERLTGLKDAFFEVGSEIFPLYVMLLLDPRQPPEIRGYIVDLFQRTHRVKELVQVYETSIGKAQLAAAIALGDAGVYIGVGTLIEALGIDDPDLRKLVVAKLTEYTGEDFGFDPMQPATGQGDAVEQWKQWWDEHRLDAEQAALALMKPGEVSESRDRASQLWREGTRHWEANEITRAEAFFQRAIDTDPTCAPPFVCLGIIAYQEHGDYIGAEDYLRRAVRRVTSEGQNDVLRLAYYHLGRIREIALRFREAQRYFEKAIDIDPNYAEAWRELGNVVFRDALNLDGDPEVRLNRFRQAARIYEKGREGLAQYREKLVFLTLDSLPISNDLPFSSRTHNKGLNELRKRLENTEAQFAYEIAVIHLAIGERDEALRWVEKALEAPAPRVDDHLLAAQIYRELGRSKAAETQMQKARALDPTDPRVVRD
ncbi:MAG: tetratricopeptide repeat protein [Planctomycetota bacterium]